VTINTRLIKIRHANINDSLHFDINLSDTKFEVTFKNNIQINSEIYSGELTE